MKNVSPDELNKYAPGGSKESPITQQVLDVAERGRSLIVILISAQQFMSAVHPRVTGNSTTKKPSGAPVPPRSMRPTTASWTRTTARRSHAWRRAIC
jgi:hypothetical protein